MNPGPIKTRMAVAADAVAIANLHAQSWRIAYRGMLSDEFLDKHVVGERTALWQERFRVPAANQYVLVAEVDGAMTGFACAYGGEDQEWGSFLDNLHVTPERKREGIGSTLMQDVARWSLKSWPQCGMYLWVLESNMPAIQFYEKLGGRLAGEGKWNPPDGGAYRKLRYAWDDLGELLRTSRSAT